MTVALLSIGTELLRGEITNTNASWLADQLSQLGFSVTTIEVVADDREPLKQALERLIQSHDLLIATGGLGPTDDDITAEVAGSACGVELQHNEHALAAIKRRLEQQGKQLRAGHEKQAQLPKGVELLANNEGTNPGFVLRHERGVCYFLPGVPREAQRMFTEHVLPRIRTSAPHNSFYIRLRTYGLSESAIQERLEGVSSPEVTLHYAAHDAEVDVKVLARESSYVKARELAEQTAAQVRSRLGVAVYGEGEDSLPKVAARCVRSKGWRLATAESCTGGLIARKLTVRPASDFFVGGAVTYANAAKSGLLGVSEDTLRWHGAVSAEVAAEMAEAARRAFDCDVALSVTGIAGPTGATSDKPLGLCHFAVAHPGGTVCDKHVFSGDREQVQLKAAKAVLNLLRRTLCA